MDNYNFGRAKEALVAADMQRQGCYSIQFTVGSRGPFDIAAKLSTGQTVFVQVKASRTSIERPIATADDKTALKNYAAGISAKAYIAYIVGSNIEYESLV